MIFQLGRHGFIGFEPMFVDFDDFQLCSWIVDDFQRCSTKFNDCSCEIYVLLIYYSYGYRYGYGYGYGYNIT